MRDLSSSYLTVGLLLVALVIDLLVLQQEIEAAIAGAICADLMRSTFILCDPGPSGWLVALTLGVGLVLAAGLGFVAARTRRADSSPSVG